MKHSIFSSSFLVLIASSLSLTACSGPMFNGAEEAKPIEVRHPITLTKKETALEVSVNHIGGKLSNKQKSQLKSFIYGYNDKGQNSIVISVPETGIKATPARVATKEITEIIEELGINQENIMIGTYIPKAGQAGNITVKFDTIKAIGPKCDDKWSENLADAYNNKSWKGLGCSTRSNFAAMIANPNDLIEMRPMGPGHAARRIDAHNKYILGQSTGASRGANETAESTAQ